MKQETMEVLDGLKAEVAQLAEEVRQLKEQLAQQQAPVNHYHYSFPVVEQHKPQPWEPIPWYPVNPLNPPWRIWCGTTSGTDSVVVKQS